MSFYSKDSGVMNRQLKVQRLSIPFVIVGSATAANVSLTSDEPSILFLRSAGVDQITEANGALNSGDTATYASSPNDANGVFNILVQVQEQVEKVVSARIASRIDGVSHPVYLGSTAGVVQNNSENGTGIMLTCDSTVAFNAANTLSACLEVEYIVAE